MLVDDCKCGCWRVVSRVWLGEGGRGTVEGVLSPGLWVLEKRGRDDRRREEYGRSGRKEGRRFRVGD